MKTTVKRASLFLLYSSNPSLEGANAYAKMLTIGSQVKPANPKNAGYSTGIDDSVVEMEKWPDYDMENLSKITIEAIPELRGASFGPDANWYAHVIVDLSYDSVA